MADAESTPQIDVSIVRDCHVAVPDPLVCGELFVSDLQTLRRLLWNRWMNWELDRWLGAGDRVFTFRVRL